MGFSLGDVFESVTKPVSKAIGGVSKGISGILGDDLGSALTMGALTAGVILSGGALAGAAGMGAGGLAALTSGAGLAATAGGALTGYQASAAQRAADKQAAAQQAALDASNEAIRQQTIMRKKAMLAEQTGLAARSNAARNIRNNLQGLAQQTTVTKLGNETQQLGA